MEDQTLPIDLPTDPTDSGGTTPSTTPSGGGGTGGGTTPTTTVLDLYHGQGVEIRIYDSDGKRRRLPALNIADCRWTIEPAGGYADFSLTLHAEPTDLATFSEGDMVEIWDFGIRQFRGYVGDLTRSEDEPPTLTVSGYGRVIDLERTVLAGAYQRANPTDLSAFFVEIGADIQARYPDIVVNADYIGVTTQNIDARAKTAKAVLDSLLQLAASVAVYGFDVDGLGRDRLYLRAINTSAVEATIAIPGANVGHRESAKRGSDVVNCVTVVGGTPQFPQLLPNGSFEILTEGGASGDGSQGDNLILNASFEGVSYDGHGNNDEWTFTGGASIHKLDARTGSWSLELDSVGEQASQTSDSPPLPIISGHQYEVGTWIRAEEHAALSNPPVVTLNFCWRVSGSDQTATTWTFTASENTYRNTYVTVTAPAGATGFHFWTTLTSMQGTGSQGEGVECDDFYLIDTNALAAEDWSLVVHGSATVNAYNWQQRGAYDGRNCLFLDVSAEDADGQDIHVRIIPRYMASLAGGQTVRLSARVKSVSGAALPSFFLVDQFYDSSGNISGSGEHRHTFGGVVYSNWTCVSSDEAAPGNATQVECWLTIRGSGQMLIDAVSARVVPDQGDESLTDMTYIPSGSLQVTYRADDLVSAATNAEVHDSIVTYGLREKVENAGDLTTLTDAKNWATSYLLANAVAFPAPVVDLYDDRRPWAIGQAIRLTGQYGAAYANRMLPLLRINGSISADGLLTHSLEIGKLRHTDEELIAKLSLKNAYKALT